ncbi:restriction endonuclease subunit S [Aeromonas salmonicida]|uniref:restriction endonuclease subunit S n=1 Tax=Aeromonas salmonicida TaxID=645 RepID=UPI0010410275|nr:restriction endonuclease subunit S [Aeromonas salmonicida]
MSNSLPQSWSSCTLADIAIINPKTVADESLIAGFVPMSHAPTSYHGELRFDEKPWGEIKKSYTNFQDGDVIFAKVTPCFENGKAAVVENFPNSIGAGSSEFYVLRPHCSDISKKLLFAIIKTHAFMQDGATNMTGAVGLRRVPKSFVETFPIALPPAAEQKEIANRLDKLLAQVEANQACLARIPYIIKRFRQSVLTAAVNGKLTEEWRKISGSTKKTSRTEILNARRLAWEKFEFKRLAGNGKFPINDKWKQKYKEPNEVLSDNVFDIPESWEWSNLSELSWSVKDGPHYSPKYTESGVPFISGGNVSPSGIDFSNCKYISHELHEELSKRCKPDIGDILYTKGGTTGIAFFNTEEINFNVWVHVAVLKITPITNGFYLQHALNSKHCYGQSQNYTHGVGNQDLGLTRMVNITIPVPPIDEQTEIVRRVEQLFAYADTVEQQAKVAKARVDKLTQAILAKAFRGELTADWRAANPDMISGNNSAAALLARIQAERATTGGKKKKRTLKQ